MDYCNQSLFPSDKNRTAKTRGIIQFTYLIMCMTVKYVIVIRWNISDPCWWITSAGRLFTWRQRTASVSDILEKCSLNLGRKITG
jgi:hypothetical protein